MTYERLQPLTIQEIRDASRKAPERGYPPVANRLYISPRRWADMVEAQAITIPEGPWSIAEHYNRQGVSKALLDPIATEENPMSAARIRRWKQLGLQCDTAGRPLHPRAVQLLTTRGVGMFTQPGFHYRYGPQRMGNLGLRRVRQGVVEYAATQVQRSTLKWGLPGGYVEANETTMNAAFREALEEAGIQKKALGAITTREIFTPPKGFKRDTLHAWGEEWFTFVGSNDNPGLDGVTLQTRDAAEVVDVAWMKLNEIKRHPDFISTHRAMILSHEAQLRK